MTVNAINGTSLSTLSAIDGITKSTLNAINGQGLGSGPGGAYQKRRAITIDHTKVPNTDQTDFPVLISGTFTYLKTVGNGGDVQNGSGFDVVFTSDQAGTSQLDHEIETYNASTGEVNFWVKVPSLSHTVDTVIYVHYSNSSVSTSQENVSGVWSNNFVFVAHLPDATTLDGTDSVNNVTPSTSGVPTAAAGQIDGAASFNTSSFGYPDSAALSPTAAISVSLWFKRAGIGANMVLLTKGDGASNAASSYEYVFNSSNQLRFEINNGSGWRTAQYSTAISDTTNWHHAFGTFDGSNVRIYTDNTLRTTTAFSGSINNDNQSMRLGRLANGTQAYNGLLDEVRIASVARSADWIATEYNNQNSPGTFFSVGSEL